MLQLVPQYVLGEYPFFCPKPDLYQIEVPEGSDILSVDYDSRGESMSVFVMHEHIQDDHDSGRCLHKMRRLKLQVLEANSIYRGPPARFIGTVKVKSKSKFLTRRHYHVFEVVEVV